MISLPRDMKLASRTIVRGLRGILALVVIASSGTHLACEDSCECSSRIRAVGLLSDYPEMPETATAGVPLEISFQTGGDGCYGGGDPLADTEVWYEKNGWVAVVTPYDFVNEALAAGEGDSCCFVCPSIGLSFEHKANVVFQDPGTARLVVATRAEGIGPPGNATTLLVYTVEVSPPG